MQRNRAIIWPIEVPWLGGLLAVCTCRGECQSLPVSRKGILRIKTTVDVPLLGVFLLRPVGTGFNIVPGPQSVCWTRDQMEEMVGA